MSDAIHSQPGFGQDAGRPQQPAPQVCGQFHGKDALEAALSRLEGSRFQRADLSVRYSGHVDPGHADSTIEEPMRRDDTRNLRQLGIGIATVIVGFGAAWVAVATGAGLLVTIAAAVLAGGVTIAVSEVVSVAQAPGGDTAMHRATGDPEGVVLLVHAATPELRRKAREILQACGAARIWEARSA